MAVITAWFGRTTAFGFLESRRFVESGRRDVAQSSIGHAHPARGLPSLCVQCAFALPLLEATPAGVCFGPGVRLGRFSTGLALTRRKPAVPCRCDKNDRGMFLGLSKAYGAPGLRVLQVAAASQGPHRSPPT